MNDPIRQRDVHFPDDEVVSTPEGDDEYPPDIPVGPPEGMQIPNGNAPTVYDADKPSHPHRSPRGSDDPTDPPEKSDAEETVDRLSFGQILA